MLRFIKRRSNSRSADKVVDEAEVSNKTSSHQSANDDEDSGYGEKQGLHRVRSRMKSFSCEDLIAVGSCSQNRRRQSAAASDLSRVNTKSTSSSSSISEEQIPQFPRLCSVDIDGKGQCELVKDGYDEFENQPVKYRRKTSVHLKVFNFVVV